MAGAGGPAAAALRHVFVYGTLMAPEVLTAVIHRCPSSATALVRDFHRYSLKNRLYPAVTALVGDDVTGKVLFDITEKELELLDVFEDVEYTRQVVEASVLDKSLEDVNLSIAVPLHTYMYVWANAEDVDLYGDWDYEAWRKNHLAQFMRRELE